MLKKIVWKTARSRLVRFRHSDPLSPYPTDTSKVDKVTICGALNPLGQHLAFLLKRADIIREIALYDDGNVRGLALDLEHMNTRTRVKPNSGDYSLKNALRHSDIVVITNGFEASLEMEDECVLRANANMMYKYGVKVASVCPEALAMKSCGMYDPNKIFGVCSLMEMRANSIVSEYLSIDPAAVCVPILGGATPATMVPILSHAKPYNEFTDAEVAELTNAILEVPEQCKRLHTAAPLSTAYALTRFVLTASAGLCCKSCTTQTAFVRSDVFNQVKYFASNVLFGMKGVIENYGVPKILEYELNLLQVALGKIEMDLAKACQMFSEIIGEARKEEIEEFCRPRKPFIIKTPCPPCPPCLPTDVCQEKLPEHPCAPSREDKAWSF